MTQIVKAEPEQTYALLTSDSMMRQIQMACGRNLNPDRLARIVFTELRRIPDLAQCSQASFFGAVMQCAQTGLEPGPMGLCWILPRKNKGKWEANFQIGYKGTLQLIHRSEQIKSVQAEVVYSNDHFEYRQGIDPVLEHIPADNDRGQPTHVWAALGTKSGGWIFRVMTKDQIDAHRQRFSRAGGGSPWDTDWDEMACKTVLIRTAKRAPISAEARQAIELDEMAARGVSQNLHLTLDADSIAERPVAEAGDEEQGPADSAA